MITPSDNDSIRPWTFAYDAAFGSKDTLQNNFKSTLLHSHGDICRSVFHVMKAD